MVVAPDGNESLRTVTISAPNLEETGPTYTPNWEVNNLTFNQVGIYSAYMELGGQPLMPQTGRRTPVVHFYVGEGMDSVALVEVSDGVNTESCSGACPPISFFPTQLTFSFNSYAEHLDPSGIALLVNLEGIPNTPMFDEEGIGPQTILFTLDNYSGAVPYTWNAFRRGLNRIGLHLRNEDGVWGSTDAQIFIETPASAGTLTWTGAANDHNWWNPENWSPQRYPMEYDAIVIENPATFGAQMLVQIPAGTAEAESVTLTGNAKLEVWPDAALHVVEQEQLDTYNPEYRADLIVSGPGAVLELQSDTEVERALDVDGTIHIRDGASFIGGLNVIQTGGGLDLSRTASPTAISLSDATLVFDEYRDSEIIIPAGATITVQNLWTQKSIGDHYARIRGGTWNSETESLTPGRGTLAVRKHLTPLEGEDESFNWVGWQGTLEVGASATMQVLAEHVEEDGEMVIDAVEGQYSELLVSAGGWLAPQDNITYEVGANLTIHFQGSSIDDHTFAAVLAPTDPLHRFGLKLEGPVHIEYAMIFNINRFGVQLRGSAGNVLHLSDSLFANGTDEMDSAFLDADFLADNRILAYSNLYFDGMSPSAFSFRTNNDEIGYDVGYQSYETSVAYEMRSPQDVSPSIFASASPIAFDAAINRPSGGVLNGAVTKRLAWSEITNNALMAPMSTIMEFHVSPEGDPFPNTGIHKVTISLPSKLTGWRRASVSSNKAKPAPRAIIFQGTNSPIRQVYSTLDLSISGTTYLPRGTYHMVLVGRTPNVEATTAPVKVSLPRKYTSSGFGTSVEYRDVIRMMNIGGNVINASLGQHLTRVHVRSTTGSLAKHMAILGCKLPGITPSQYFGSGTPTQTGSYGAYAVLLQNSDSMPNSSVPTHATGGYLASVVDEACVGHSEIVVANYQEEYDAPPCDSWDEYCSNERTNVYLNHASAADLDGDGLHPDLEQELKTCSGVDNSVTRPAVGPVACENEQLGSSHLDTDGDGLSDYDELLGVFHDGGDSAANYGKILENDSGGLSLFVQPTSKWPRRFENLPMYGTSPVRRDVLIQFDTVKDRTGYGPWPKAGDATTKEEAAIQLCSFIKRFESFEGWPSDGFGGAPRMHLDTWMNRPALTKAIALNANVRSLCEQYVESDCSSGGPPASTRGVCDVSSPGRLLSMLRSGLAQSNAGSAAIGGSIDIAPADGIPDYTLVRTTGNFEGARNFITHPVRRGRFHSFIETLGGPWKENRWPFVQVELKEGTMRHEFGHRLGLGHGGAEPTSMLASQGAHDNDPVKEDRKMSTKPHYRSLMNYRDGADVYQSEDLRSLNFSALCEEDGIGNVSFDAKVEVYATEDIVPIGTGVDWNRDGTLDAGCGSRWPGMTTPGCGDDQPVLMPHRMDVEKSEMGSTLPLNPIPASPDRFAAFHLTNGVYLAYSEAASLKLLMADDGLVNNAKTSPQGWKSMAFWDTAPSVSLPASLNFNDIHVVDAASLDDLVAIAFRRVSRPGEIKVLTFERDIVTDNLRKIGETDWVAASDEISLALDAEGIHWVYADTSLFYCLFQLDGTQVSGPSIIGSAARKYAASGVERVADGGESFLWLAAADDSRDNVTFFSRRCPGGVCSWVEQTALQLLVDGSPLRVAGVPYSQTVVFWREKNKSVFYGGRKLEVRDVSRVVVTSLPDTYFGAVTRGKSYIAIYLLWHDWSDRYPGGQLVKLILIDPEGGRMNGPLYGLPLPLGGHASDPVVLLDRWAIGDSSGQESFHGPRVDSLDIVYDTSLNRAVYVGEWVEGREPERKNPTSLARTDPLDGALSVVAADGIYDRDISSAADWKVARMCLARALSDTKSNVCD